MTLKLMTQGILAEKKTYTQDAEMYTHTPRKRLHIHTHSLAQCGSLVYWSGAVACVAE